MEYRDDCYYKFTAVDRRKDHPEAECLDNTVNHSGHGESAFHIIHEWYVSDPKELARLEPMMRTTVEKFKCRLYMNVDRKSVVKTLREMRDECMRLLDNCHDSALNSSQHFPFDVVRGMSRMMISISSSPKSSDKGGLAKKIIFDIDGNKADTPENGENIFIKFRDFLKKALEDKLGADKVFLVPTVNGCHIVVPRTFDANEFITNLRGDGSGNFGQLLGHNPKLLEIKKDSMTLVLANV